MNNQERCYDMGHHNPGGHIMSEQQAHHHNKMEHHGHQNLMHHFHGMEHCHHQPQMIHGVECPPVVKCPIEKVCHRDIHHKVTHIQPIHTRIVNRHIYNHCCVPHFTCSEENICCHTGNPCC